MTNPTPREFKKTLGTLFNRNLPLSDCLFNVKIKIKKVIEYLDSQVLYGLCIVYFIPI